MTSKGRYLGLGLAVLVAASRTQGWQARSAPEEMLRQPHVLPHSVPQAAPTPHCVSSLEPVTNPGLAGPVMPSFAAYLIFWLPAGAHFESSAAGDLNYEHLLERYFQDVGESSFNDILSQYGGSNGVPSTTVSIGGVLVDTTALPRPGTVKNPLLDSDLQNEILNVINTQSWPVGLDVMYFIFTGQGIESCTDASRTFCTFTTASSNGYCAYHSAFGVISDLNQQFPVIYASMPDALSIAPNGECGIASPNGDMDADTEISVTSHEHFEAVSDPLGDAWIDAEACEIGDKCAVHFDTSAPDIMLNGHPYYVQEEWSNAAAGCTLTGPPVPTATASLVPTPTQTPSVRPTATSTPLPITPTPTPVRRQTPPVTTTPSPRTSAFCIGDCNGTHTVAINDVITLVSIALGTTQPSACPNGVPSSAEVTVAVLVQAVTNALNGCGGG